MTDHPSHQSRIRMRQQVVDRCGFDHIALLVDLEAGLPGLEPNLHPEIDRHVHGRAAGMKETDRPDIQGAAGQVDPAARDRSNHVA